MSDPNIVAGPTPAEFYRGATMPHLVGSEEFAELADRVAALEKKASPVVVVDENVPRGMYYGMPAANTWEQEAAHDAGKEKLVEELTKAINDTMDTDLDWSDVARKLIDAGWTKGSETG